MANQEGRDLVTQLVDSVREITGLPECRNAARKMYGNLVRRLKLLSPLFKELKDSEEKLDGDDVNGLQALVIALNLALELLKSVNQGSKIFQNSRSTKEIRVQDFASRECSVGEEIENPVQ